ncbi:MAG: acetate/propionate family kinase, partial [Saccharothrix sp.]|nr:acetate/propionate family kinase [Saccharothrix sp.]
RLAFLGVAVDPERNERVDGDTDITAADTDVRTLVIEAREDLEIAHGTRRALSR